MVVVFEACEIDSAFTYFHAADVGDFIVTMSVSLSGIGTEEFALRLIMPTLVLMVAGRLSNDLLMEYSTGALSRSSGTKV